jgi:hypothetical protein
MKRTELATIVGRCARAIALSLALTFALAACSTTSSELRSSPRETGNFHVELSYEAVRSNFITQTARCFHGGTPASHFYPEVRDTRPGQATTIDVVQSGIATRVIISNEITRNPSGGTDISYFIGPVGVLVKYRPVIEGWATGVGNKCGSFFE